MIAPKRALLLVVLVVPLFGCEWVHYTEGDSYTDLMVPYLPLLSGCETVVHSASGRRLEEMIADLPARKAELRAETKKPLVIFTAGGVNALAGMGDTQVAFLLDYWAGELLRVRDDLELVQLDYPEGFPQGFLALTNQANEPRWHLMHFADLEPEYRYYPQDVHLLPEWYVMRIALLFRAGPRFLCEAGI